MCVVVRNKYKNEFLETSIHFVFAEKSKNIKELENIQDQVKEFGGAGKIYHKDGVYYLILNAYFDKESADLVVDNNKNIYMNAGVLELKTKKIESRTIKKIKATEFNVRFLKKLNSDLSKVIELQMKYFSGVVSENDLCSNLLTLKFEVDDLIYDIKSGDHANFKELVLNYSSLLEMYYSAFFNNFFDSDKKSSILCDFVVGLALLKIDFFNNL